MVDAENPSSRDLIASLAKFTRNLVAAVPGNQTKAFDNEPLIRDVLFTYTSYCSSQDESNYRATILLIQSISNMVTGNEVLLTRFWDIWMNVPESLSVILRLLGSPDTRTILSALVLILNCVHGSVERSTLFTTTPLGLRIIVTILDRMVSFHDVEELSDGGQAFEIGYSIFSRLIDFGLLPDLYTHISLEDEIITPHQTVLLKLLDSYLQTAHLTVVMCQQLCPMIASTFFDLGEYNINAIDRALSFGHIYPAPAQTSEAPLAAGELDMLLPSVCEALVLMTQCLITFALTSEDEDFDFPPGDNPKDFLNAATVEEGVGMPEVIISLLQRFDRLLPRVMFGKPVDLSTLPLPPEVNHQPHPASSTAAGFSYVKRDLVRLLGILCVGEKAVQDRIRACGGIPVIMNLCVVDERNPYLREHAIFALHNLLEGNAENQRLVDQIRPLPQPPS
ncbi:hypothetical protein BDM02DRAFT_3095712 [Thelephora ganbajun]|uniref:Uncharacterized protein n=1 Tax=Thelephora ganbajun TaxID=370292 RepID=A0ACB6ZH20_THEGA|nr:hypothetical protein BDM02DRAFT_3095712 [Thelephora ganbajun]